MTQHSHSTYHLFLHPRYLLVWLVAGLLFVLGRLPWLWQLKLGKALGRLLYQLGRRRREVARTNLRLCFPETTPAQREIWLREHFQNLGIGVFELALAWWGSKRNLHFVEQHSHITGLNHLHDALAQGQGVLLLSAHFTTLEITGKLLLQRQPIAVMYRAHENPALEYLFQRSRQRKCVKAIRRDDVKGVLQALKAKQIVWYAPDQAYRSRHSVLVSFFRIPAATNTATSRIARISGAKVLPFFAHRQANGSYQLTIGKALDDFPGQEITDDALRINRLIEEAIRQAPAQYLWTHKRFKYKKDWGMQDFYCSPNTEQI